METMKKAPRLTNKEDKGEETLDANVWGKLQEYIPLQTLYEKLSQRDLFRLRLVSKEWNHAALQWILPKPSLMIIVAGVPPWVVPWVVWFLKGLVSYNSVSGKFKFNRRSQSHKTHVRPFEVKGLILCHNPDDLEERGVFNVHTQTWHVILAGPKQSKRLSACGLLVDSTVKPYTFKLVEGNCNFRTQIYDSKSRSWSRTSSRLPSSFMESNQDTLEYSCICNNNDIYISQGPHMIRKYSLEDDKWTKLKSPNLRNSVIHSPADNTLGVWEGRIFTTKKDFKEKIVIVWELVDSEGQEWVESVHMPKELYGWLSGCDIIGNFAEIGLRSFFRDGYLLVCCWQWDNGCSHALGLFDIATKVWRKVDLPEPLAINERAWKL